MLDPAEEYGLPFDQAVGRRIIRMKKGMAMRSLSMGFAALVLLALLGLPGVSLACGTVDMWISVYEEGGRHKALFHMLDCADSYQAPEDDQKLLPVLLDAMGRHQDVAELACSVFKHFNCLYGARNSVGYQELLKQVADRTGPIDLAKFKDWLIVTANNGANVRKGPSTDTQVITAVKPGMQVRLLERSGQWMKIRPVGPGSIDPRFERKVGYVHESLLKPY